MKIDERRKAKDNMLRPTQRATEVYNIKERRQRGVPEGTREPSRGYLVKHRRLPLDPNTCTRSLSS